MTKQTYGLPDGTTTTSADQYCKAWEDFCGPLESALRRAGVSDADVDAFRAEATSGDYDHVLQTAMAWVDVS